MVFCKWSRREAGACDLKTYYALAAFWRTLPPAEIQLAHIGSALGIKSAPASPASPGGAASSPPPQAAQSDDAITLAIQQSGMPVFEGALPADMAALLADLPLT
jgi:hypothetical protein